tara:strand:+ start:121 stop:429 length:309 start_codon:yes stop_codon:yes gene_type:complete
MQIHLDRSSPKSVTHTDSATNTEKQNADVAESRKFITLYQYNKKFLDLAQDHGYPPGLPIYNPETVGLPTKDTKRRLPKETDGTASLTQTKEPTAKKDQTTA